MSSTTGSHFDPRSLSFANATTMTRGPHTFKGGVEYRTISSRLQFLGSNELSYNSINDFVDNRPNQYALTADSPFFEPQQFYFIGFLQDSWRVGDIVNARSGVPLNVTISRPDNVTVNGATVTNIPGGNSRGTQRPDLVPGVDPYVSDGGVRWLNPAAFATPQPGTFGNLPRNYLRGPAFAQFDRMFSKDFRFASSQGLQFRIEMFNLFNRLNYENPATTLPNGAPGLPFTDAQAGTFGCMLGPLNRTVGLGTARQTQISLRFTF